MDKRHIILAHAEARKWAVMAVEDAPIGHHVIVQEPTRNLDQNAKFHAICTDLEKSRFQWAGKPRKAKAWKVLLVSAHAVATKEGHDLVPGIEGEFVNLRESTALMSVKRSSSLIEYTVAFCVTNGIPMRKSDANQRGES